MAETEITPRGGARWHPLADIFPWIEGEAFKALVDDVRKNGVLEPIVFHEGMILDGRNRYMAAREVGIPYPRIDYDGPDPLAFVIARNLSRRHLDTSQRAMVASRLAKLTPGRPAENAETSVISSTQEEAAAVLNVSVDSVQAARKVEEAGTPELVKAVDAGKVSVSAAAALAALPVERQVEIIGEVAKTGNGKKAFAQVAKKVRAETQERKKVARAVKENILGERLTRLPDKRFGVILADPEWQFEPHSRETGMDRAADNHYPTSSLDVIKARPVASIAADDCVLFLWATAPMLPQALEVMAAWGFSYASQIVWVKDRIGTGYWFRNKHEVLLVGTRGSVPAPAMGTQYPSVIDAAVLMHSQKPNDFLEMIEKYFPTLPKIELNRRGPARPGWSAWGNEAEDQAA